MKKIVTMFLVFATGLSLLSAAEPLVIASTASPLILFSEEKGNVKYDLKDLAYSDAVKVVALPALMKDCGAELDDLLSRNPIKFLSAAFDGLKLYSSINDFQLLNGEGSLSIDLFYPEKGEGDISALIGYDGISMLYKTNGWTERRNINGESRITLSWCEDPLFTVEVAADTDLSGKGSVSLSLYLDTDTVNDYLSSSQYKISDLRKYTLEMIFSEIPMELCSYLLGSDLSALEPDEIIDILKEKNMLDILDYLTFYIWASYDIRLSEIDPFTMGLIPVLSIDGKERKDIDLRGILKDYIQLIYAIDNL